jgi:hypothetical protein
MQFEWFVHRAASPELTCLHRLHLISPTLSSRYGMFLNPITADYGTYLEAAWDTQLDRPDNGQIANTQRSYNDIKCACMNFPNGFLDRLARSIVRHPANQENLFGFCHANPVLPLY